MARLIFMPFLQRWDGTQLSLNLLAAPQYSPLDPLVAGEPSFTDADFTFDVRLVRGLASLPTTAAPFTAIDQPTVAPPKAREICEGLAAQLPIDQTVTPVDPRAGSTRFLKYTPPPYRQATGYVDGGSPYLRVDDTYHCALKATIPAGTVLTSDPPPLGWGKVLASALRQPLLAHDIGLIRRFAVTPSDPGFFEAGGWVYVTLAAGSPAAGVLSLPDGLKTYAARVPPLPKARSLFTSVLFPVAASVPAADYDDVFREVVDYDDGFAKAVYAAQPTVLDPLGEEDDGTRPHTDHGVRLGWDDEQVATWLNRQIDPTAATANAPMGVLGYRVDARDAGTIDWHSLVMGTTSVTVNGLDLGTYTGEFRVEVAANKLMSDATGTYWIPSYYTGWTGPSLIAFDRTEATLQGINRPSVVEGVDPDIDLRYGRPYDFRVRLVDHTGGGAAVDDEPVNPAPQPLAPLRFRRWVRPGALRLDTALPVVPDPAQAPDKITVCRPRLGYPACVMAGGSKSALVADLPEAAAERRAVGLPDPDVDAAEVEVSVAFPGSQGGYRVLYSTTRPFPPGADDALDLALDWTDVADATTLAPPAAGPLPVPTARAVRIAVNALAADKADYYGSPDVRHGPQTTLAAAKYSTDESHLLAAASSDPVEGIDLQPDALVTGAVALSQKAAGAGLVAPDNALGRLAAALDLDVVSTGLRARPGHRVIFGCGSGVAHTLGPDHGSIQFGSVNDLTLVWIVVVRLELRRDWSWDGLDHLRIAQAGVEVGRVEPGRTVAHEALSDAPVDRSEIVFFDVFDPKPAAGQFPTEPQRTYTVSPVFRHAPGTADLDLTYDLHLPITTPPSQLPRLVSAGLALSPYTRDAGYSHSDPRRRVLVRVRRAAREPGGLVLRPRTGLCARPRLDPGPARGGRAARAARAHRPRAHPYGRARPVG